MSIGRLLNDYWKLKALEPIEASSSGELPKEEYVRLVDTLIDNHQVKNIPIGSRGL